MIRQALSQADFQICSVWSWAESDDAYTPVRIASSLPIDKGPLLVRAKMISVKKLEFDGYVVGLGPAYAIGIFANGRTYSFNRNLKRLSEETLERLFIDSKMDAQAFFPLAYFTDFKFEDGENINGFFSLD